ncbi:MAG: T9SS type A sorting domain-containing protein, partial [Chryseolinea sp.]
DATTSTTITIGGNLIIDGRSSVWFSRAATTSVFVGGDFKNLSASTASSYLTTTGKCQVNVEGNFEMNSTSILRFASGSLTGTGTLRVNKNFSFIAGTITVSAGTGVGTVEMKGAASQLFSSLGTWTSGVNLLINNSQGVIAQTNSKVEGNVTVSAIGLLKLPSSNFILHGNLTEQTGGSIQTNEGTLTLAGSVNQSLTLVGDSLHHTNINKSSGTSVTFSNGAKLSGTLSILSTNTTVFSNGNLTLLSSSDDGNADASINSLPTGSSVSGNVNVQRYMSGEGRMYRYISSPVSNASIYSLMDDFPITGTFDDPSTGPGIRPGSLSFFYYDETLSGSLGWIAYPFAGSASENFLVVGKGYSAFIREPSNATTWDVNGNINQGDIILPTTFTNTGNPSNDGWNLVGNPYPSSIDWNVSSGWDKTHIDNGIVVRDNGSGNFLYWDGEVGNLGSGRIAKGQSFWIKTNALNPLLKIKETAKTSAPTIFYRKKISEPDYLEISIQTKDHADKTYLRLRDRALAEYDSLDVVKFPNDFMNFSFEGSKTPLAISAIDRIDCSKSYPLNLSFVKKSDGTFVRSPIGEYTIATNAFGLFVNNEIVLHDNFTNSDLNIATANYSFTITQDSASFKSDRFSLYFNSPILKDSLTILHDSIMCDTSPFYKIELKNVQENTRYKVLLSNRLIDSYLAQQNDSLSFEIATEELNDELSTITVDANNLCHSEQIEEFNVWRQLTHLPTLIAETACNSKTTTLHIENAKEAIAFNWYDHNHSLIAQTQDSSLIVPIEKSSAFYASSVFNHECTSNLSSVHVDVVQFEIPIITENNGLLLSNHSTGNQWYLNEEKIIGANQSTFEPLISGNYSLMIMYDGCIDSASYQFTYQDETLHVFPNPVENEMHVVAPKGEEILKLEAFNASGQLIQLFLIESIAKAETLAMDDLNPGIYSLNVITTKNQYRRRILKK